MRDLRVVFMGTPDFSVGILKSMLESGIQVVACVTVADKPAGRGQQVQESAVKRFAVTQGIPVLQPLKLKDPQFLEELQAFNADVFVVVAFRMLPAEVWKMPQFGTFNLHASLLPDYRGAAPINWTIINGDSKTGVTTFFIDEEIDTGNIIAQVPMDIAPDETAGELHDRMMLTGGKLVVDTIHSIASDNIRTIPQDTVTEGLKRPAPKLFRENTQINWSLSGKTIHQLVCGLSPYPAAWTRWTNAKGESRVVKFYKTRFEEKSVQQTGQLLADKQTIRVSCGDGELVILELQMEGKKRMSAKDWLVGNSISDWKIENDVSSTELKD